MKSQIAWLPPVSLLLVCGMIGCGRKAEPVVEEPNAAVEKSTIVVSTSTDSEEPESATEKPEAAEGQHPPEAPQSGIGDVDRGKDPPGPAGSDT
jgi:hypothetical protein